MSRGEAGGVGAPAFGSTTMTTTDWAGRPVSSSEDRDGELATSTVERDALGRVIRTADTYGTGTHREFDALGRLVRESRNQVRGASSPADLITDLVHDRDGFVVEAVDPAGQSFTRSFDGVGRLLSESRPLPEPQAVPGPRGRAGVTFVYAYDSLSRLSRVETGADVWQWTYETGTGRVAVADSPTASTSWGYDGLGVASLGIRVDATLASPVSVTTTRVNDGRGVTIREVTEPAPGFAYEVAWDYADAGRLTSLTTGDGAGSLPVQTIGLGWDGVRLGAISGSLFDSGGGQTLSTYSVRVGHEGLRTVERELAFDATGASGAGLARLTRALSLDGYGRSDDLAWHLGDASGFELGRHEQVYGQAQRTTGDAQRRRW